MGLEKDNKVRKVKEHIFSRCVLCMLLALMFIYCRQKSAVAKQVTQHSQIIFSFNLNIKYSPTKRFFLHL
jgi:hypothetical protein